MPKFLVAAEPLASNSEFAAFVDEVWDWELSVDPWLAIEVGDIAKQGRFPDDSLPEIRRRFETRSAFLTRLDAFPINDMTDDDRINRDVLRHRLSNAISNYKFKAYLMPLNGREGFHVSVGQLPDTVKFETESDFKNYLAILSDFSRYVDEQIVLMQTGLNEGHTVPSIVLRDIESQLQGLIGEKPSQSELYKPFTKSKPSAISDSDWKELQTKAIEVLEQNVAPGMKRFQDFMREEYLPKTRTSIAARALPDGKAYYQDRIEHFTTLPMTAAEVHQVGLREVERIRTEMDGVMKQVGFEGNLQEFISALQKDEKQYAKSPRELLEFASYILKRIDGELPTVFSVLPRTPYGLKEIPAFVAPQTTSAYYMPPAGDGSRAGIYFLNTYNLPQRPKFEMVALALHEAVPGHHLQIALQLELPDVHPLRRFAMLTAYVEGWALYSELLGKEMGMYDDPYQDFGRLSLEAWRACRLVVDTGIHDLGWTREQAIAFMRENTALSDHNITAEVDRYIGWPGQALGYKIGQMKIIDLRRTAEKELGSKFDLREFHHQILRHGAIPLPILEEQIQRWIAEKK